MESNTKYLKESKNTWRKAKNIYIWRKAIKNIWRKAKKNCRKQKPLKESKIIWRKVKTLEGKQNYLKESKNTWRKSKPFLTEFWHLKAIVVVISSLLRLLMKVWIWYRCQNRIEHYYLHDGEQLDFHKKVHIKTQTIMHRAKRRTSL